MQGNEDIKIDEIAAMRQRILNWVSDENLSKARGKTREEIHLMFDNTPQAVSYIPVEYLPVLGIGIADNRVYSGMAYFIDHAVNHHANIAPEKYLNIQAVLDKPDAIRKIIEKGNRSVVFIKKFDRYNAVIVQVMANEDGKIILHKSFLDQRKEPYAHLHNIQPTLSLGGGVSPIIRTENSAHGSSLPALNDNTKIVQNFEKVKKK